MFCSAVTNAYLTDDVTLITIAKAPACADFIADIFGEIALCNINVDMINQTAPHNDTVEISFSVSDKDFMAVLRIVGKHKKNHPNIRTDVSTGNTKISVFGEAMRTTPGVAAAFFRLLDEAEINIKFITTSSVDISVLISQDDADRVIELINR